MYYVYILSRELFFLVGRHSWFIFGWYGPPDDLTSHLKVWHKTSLPDEGLQYGHPIKMLNRGLGWAAWLAHWPTVGGPPHHNNRLSPWLNNDSPEICLSKKSSSCFRIIIPDPRDSSYGKPQLWWHKKT